MDEIVFGIKSSLTITVRCTLAQILPQRISGHAARDIVHGELNKKRGRHTGEGDTTIM